MAPKPNILDWAPQGGDGQPTREQAERLMRRDVVQRALGELRKGLKRPEIFLFRPSAIGESTKDAAAIVVWDPHIPERRTWDEFTAALAEKEGKLLDVLRSHLRASSNRDKSLAVLHMRAGRGSGIDKEWAAPETVFGSNGTVVSLAKDLVAAAEWTGQVTVMAQVVDPIVHGLVTRCSIDNIRHGLLLEQRVIDDSYRRDFFCRLLARMLDQGAPCFELVPCAFRVVSEIQRQRPLLERGAVFLDWIAASIGGIFGHGDEGDVLYKKLLTAVISPGSVVIDINDRYGVVRCVMDLLLACGSLPDDFKPCLVEELDLKVLDVNARQWGYFDLDGGDWKFSRGEEVKFVEELCSSYSGVDRSESTGCIAAVLDTAGRENLRESGTQRGSAAIHSARESSSQVNIHTSNNGSFEATNVAGRDIINIHNYSPSPENFIGLFEAAVESLSHRLATAVARTPRVALDGALIEVLREFHAQEAREFDSDTNVLAWKEWQFPSLFVPVRIAKWEGRAVALDRRAQGPPLSMPEVIKLVLAQDRAVFWGNSGCGKSVLSKQLAIALWEVGLVGIRIDLRLIRDMQHSMRPWRLDELVFEYWASQRLPHRFVEEDVARFLDAERDRIVWIFDDWDAVAPLRDTLSNDPISVFVRDLSADAPSVRRSMRRIVFFSRMHVKQFEVHPDRRLAEHLVVGFPAESRESFVRNFFAVWPDKSRDENVARVLKQIGSAPAVKTVAANPLHLGLLCQLQGRVCVHSVTDLFDNTMWLRILRGIMQGDEGLRHQAARDVVMERGREALLALDRLCVDKHVLLSTGSTVAADVIGSGIVQKSAPQKIPDYSVQVSKSTVSTGPSQAWEWFHGSFQIFFRARSNVANIVAGNFAPPECQSDPLYWQFLCGLTHQSTESQAVIARVLAEHLPFGLEFLLGPQEFAFLDSEWLRVGLQSGQKDEILAQISTFFSLKSKDKEAKDILMRMQTSSVRAMCQGMVASKGNSESAKDWLMEALEKTPPSSGLRVTILSTLAEMFCSQGRVVEGERCVVEAEDALARNGGDDDDRLACLSAWGAVLLVKGEFHLALDRLDDSIALFDREREPLRFAVITAMKASCYYGLAKYAEAAPHFEEAVDVLDGLDPRSFALATILCAQALNDIALGGDLDTLRVRLVRAVGISQRVEGKELEVHCRSLAGVVLSALGRREEAKLEADTARAIIRKVNDLPDGPRLGAVFVNCATVYHSLGLEHDELDCVEDGLAVFRALGRATVDFFGCLVAGIRLSASKREDERVLSFIREGLERLDPLGPRGIQKSVFLWESAKAASHRGQDGLVEECLLHLVDDRENLSLLLADLRSEVFELCRARNHSNRALVILESFLNGPRDKRPAQFVAFAQWATEAFLDQDIVERLRREVLHDTDAAKLHMEHVIAANADDPSVARWRDFFQGLDREAQFRALREVSVAFEGKNSAVLHKVLAAILCEEEVHQWFRIDDCLQNGSCSFNVSGPKYVYQRFYRCYIHGWSGNKGLCRVCFEQHHSHCSGTSWAIRTCFCDNSEADPANPAFNNKQHTEGLAVQPLQELESSLSFSSFVSYTLASPTESTFEGELFRAGKLAIQGLLDQAEASRVAAQQLAKSPLELRRITVVGAVVDFLRGHSERVLGCLRPASSELLTDFEFVGQTVLFCSSLLHFQRIEFTELLVRLEAFASKHMMESPGFVRCMFALTVSMWWRVSGYFQRSSEVARAAIPLCSEVHPLHGLLQLQLALDVDADATVLSRHPLSADIFVGIRGWNDDNPLVLLSRIVEALGLPRESQADVAQELWAKLKLVHRHSLAVFESCLLLSRISGELRVSLLDQAAHHLKPENPLAKPLGLLLRLLKARHFSDNGDVENALALLDADTASVDHESCLWSRLESFRTSLSQQSERFTRLRESWAAVRLIAAGMEHFVAEAGLERNFASDDVARQFLEYVAVSTELSAVKWTEKRKFAKNLAAMSREIDLEHNIDIVCNFVGVLDSCATEALDVLDDLFFTNGGNIEKVVVALWRLQYLSVTNPEHMALMEMHLSDAAVRNLLFELGLDEQQMDVFYEFIRERKMTPVMACGTLMRLKENHGVNVAQEWDNALARSSEHGFLEELGHREHKRAVRVQQDRDYEAALAADRARKKTESNDFVVLGDANHSARERQNGLNARDSLGDEDGCSSVDDLRALVYALLGFVPEERKAKIFEMCVNEGCTSVSDLSSLSDEQLASLGFGIVHMRKIRAGKSPSRQIKAISEAGSAVRPVKESKRSEVAPAAPPAQAFENSKKPQGSPVVAVGVDVTPVKQAPPPGASAREPKKQDLRVEPAEKVGIFERVRGFFSRASKVAVVPMVVQEDIRTIKLHVVSRSPTIDVAECEISVQSDTTVAAVYARVRAEYGGALPKLFQLRVLYPPTVLDEHSRSPLSELIDDDRVSLSITTEQAE